MSAIFLGVIALFIATKDRLSWKRIVVRSAIGLVAITALSGIGIYAWIRYLEHEQRPPKPVAMLEFWELNLNSTKGDVKFKKGNPDRVHAFPQSKKDPSEKREVWVYAMTDEGKTMASKGDMMPWDSYGVSFRNDEIRMIFYVGTESWKGPKLHGISAGASLETIVRLLGEPSYISISEDELERIASYEKINSYFVLRENKVEGYGIINPKFGPARHTKERAR